MTPKNDEHAGRDYRTMIGGHPQRIEPLITSMTAIAGSFGTLYVATRSILVVALVAGLVATLALALAASHRRRCK